MLLNKVRYALRVDGTDLDEDINDNIDACKADLKLSGVVKIKDDDPLIIQAIKTYARAYFDVDNPDHDKYVASYESLKMHLALAEEYTVEVVQDEGNEA